MSTQPEQSTDGGVNHDVQLALQTTPCLLNRLLRCIASFGLAGVAEAIFDGQRGHHIMSNGLVIIHHTAPVVGQLNLFGGFGRLISHRDSG